MGTLQNIVPIRPGLAIQNLSAYSEARDILRLLDGLSQEKRRRIYDLVKMMASSPTEKPTAREPVHSASSENRALLVRDPQDGGFLHVAPVGSVTPTSFEGAAQRSKLLLGPTGAVIGIKIGRYTRL